ncbi:YjjG family noncanonical pyrimidine nucleotidase [Psychrobacillus vulpis]|uniref:Noncanonical pyrimidine nucleotidase, YjjG family n=1 Tax=Psychrobacillus vulpis TaxID=2325572 RepID=A0A544TJS1_9BACI|nr:YjjG family noncanonical pyrimidine nucleotidase [Psychrobacillus vulpis]TQR17700.1 noncanonical pyrimidine nucleotidase, YjjG family [Psychrobacillus vulpis]
MRYDVLLFDLDDTLFDFGITEKNALHHLFVEYGLPNGVSDYLISYKAISKVLWNDLEHGRTSLAELKVERFKRLFLEQALDLDAEVIGQKYLENLGKEVQLMDGVEEMIANLSGCRFAILTNGFKEVQHARIGGSSLKDVFEAIITSEETGYQKPQSEIFEYTLDKLQILDKSRVLMIGDSLSSDIQGGNNFGIDTCWFNPHMKKNDTVIQPTYEIQTWSEFLDIVKKEVVEVN